MRYFLFILLIGLSALNISMYSDEVYGLLTEGDIVELEKFNEYGPALSSVPGKAPYWESFNEWQCFSTDNLELRISEHIIDSVVRVPTLSVFDEGHLYEFEVSISIVGDKGDLTLRYWEGLLEDAQSFCVMAAFLQHLGSSNQSLWILHTFKTKRGYWSESDLF